MTDYRTFFLTPFLIALQLLTRIPVKVPQQISEREIGCSLIYYPLTGLIIGIILYFSLLIPESLLSNASAGVLAAITLSLWVIITGALHIDGLADSADAWIGGFGDREKMKQIMKDSRSGPIAIVAVVLLLLLKWTALETIIQQQQSYLILIAPLLARAFILVLFNSTAYVSDKGMASEIFASFPKQKHLYTMLLISTVICALFAGISVIVFSVIIFIGLRWMMVKQLGGATGDTTGAMVEILEMTALVFLALG